jgi:hypothetical protein
MPVEIVLEPGLDHCIETVAKRKYESVLRALLGGREENPLLADELELLRLFLESADFKTLRNRCDAALIAGKRVKVKLRSAEGTPDWSIEID